MLCLKPMSVHCETNSKVVHTNSVLILWSAAKALHSNRVFIEIYMFPSRTHWVDGGRWPLLVSSVHLQTRQTLVPQPKMDMDDQIGGPMVHHLREYAFYIFHNLQLCLSFTEGEVELSYFKTRCLHSSSLKMMNWNGSFDNVDLRLGLLA